MNTLKRCLISSVAVMLSCNMMFLNANPLDIANNSNSQIEVSADTDVYTILDDSTFNNNELSYYFANSSSPNYDYMQVNSDGTISRIVYDSTNNEVVIETYSTDFKLLSTNKVSAELDIWGTFYSGSEYNFCVFGKSNQDELEENEVVRIVKYSKDWQRLDSVSLYGCNTQTPFVAGRPRLSEHDGKLYLHASHRMFKSSDGYNHQANMDFYLNIDDMSVFYEQYGVSNISTGYVSHSFDQYIKTDDNYAYTLDLGDAYPRCVAVVQRNLEGSAINNISLLDIHGNIGDNFTGVSLGGFELSADNCISVGNSISQTEDANTSVRNIFLSITGKDLSFNNTLWLTNFTDKNMVSIPKLVKIDDNTFIAMWNEFGDENKAHLVKLDGKGNILQDVTIDNVTVSDCDPVVVGNQIVWYSGTNVYSEEDYSYTNKSVLYHIDYDDLSKYGENTSNKDALKGDFNLDKSVDEKDIQDAYSYALGMTDKLDFTITPTAVSNIDLNGNGKVELDDVLKLSRYIDGLDNSLEFETSTVDTCNTKISIGEIYLKRSDLNIVDESTQSEVTVKVPIKVSNNVGFNLAELKYSISSWGYWGDMTEESSPHFANTDNILSITSNSIDTNSIQGIASDKKIIFLDASNSYSKNGDMFYLDLVLPAGWNVEWPININLQDGYLMDSEYNKYTPTLISGRVKVVDDSQPLGDCTGDGTVGTVDLLALKMYLLGMDSHVDSYSADVNQDGYINVLDLLKLKRYLLGLIDTL